LPLDQEDYAASARAASLIYYFALFLQSELKELLPYLERQCLSFFFFFFFFFFVVLLRPLPHRTSPVSPAEF
jgi:hypothetical protein